MSSNAMPSVKKFIEELLPAMKTVMLSVAEYYCVSVVASNIFRSTLALPVILLFQVALDRISGLSVISLTESPPISRVQFQGDSVSCL